MRYLIAAAVLLVIVINPSFFTGIDACAKDNSELSEWAKSRSEAADKDWERAVERSAGTIPEGTGSIGLRERVESSSKAYRRSSLLAGKRNIASQRSAWNLSPGTTGYIHKGNSGPFLPLTSRPRNGAARGAVMIDSPSNLTRGGNRRQPVNYVNIRVNTSVRSGSMRNSPSFGSRFSSSMRRGRSSSFGRLGSTRSRRRR